MMTRFAEHLVEAYGTDADATWLLDHHEVHLLLIANPDGRKHGEKGVYWRKNDNVNHCPNGWAGVDLNRNFDFEWGGSGSSGNACNQTFRGSAAGSEPETQAVMQYMRDLFPDARGPDDDDIAPLDTSGVYLDVHSYSELILYPWGYKRETAPNGLQLRRLGRKLAFFNGYRPVVLFRFGAVPFTCVPLVPWSCAGCVTRWRKPEICRRARGTASAAALGQ